MEQSFPFSIGQGGFTLPSDINCLSNAFYRLPKRLCNGVKLAFLEFRLQRSAAICALRAVDKGEVFLAQRFDDVIDVIGARSV